MVTAILPSLTNDTGLDAADEDDGPKTPTTVTRSFDSEATITPDRYRQDPRIAQIRRDSDDRERSRAGHGRPSALAGYVGLFTGCGALVALVLFLPLPARFSHIEGVTLADAVRYSFYVVGLVSFLVAVFVSIGLRGIKGEEGKGWRLLFTFHSTPSDPEVNTSSTRTVNTPPTSPFHFPHACSC